MQRNGPRDHFDNYRLFHRLRAITRHAIDVQRKTGKTIQFKLMQDRLTEAAGTTRAAGCWILMYPQAALNTPIISALDKLRG